MNRDNLISLCTKEFFSNPNWDSCLDLFRLYIDDLDSVSSIDTKGKNNDEVATELKARQITKDRIERFIEETLILKKVNEAVPTKTRKYR